MQSNSVADPGFPKWGPTYFLANFSRKLHEHFKNWTKVKGVHPQHLPPWIRQCNFPENPLKIGTIFFVQGASANVLTTQTQRTHHPPNQPPLVGPLVVVCIMKVKCWTLQQWNESPDDVEGFKQR